MGQYVLDARLAVGGMGDIFVGRQLGPDGFERACVVKTMHEHHAGDPEFVALFLEEARLSARLNHPNIAQVYDFGRAGTVYFIAMEFVDGPSLYQILQMQRARGQRIDIAVASKMIIQAALALDHAHRLRRPDGSPLNLVHRDVSPANLLLSSEGVVKLIDFGIAKASTTERRTGTGVVRGKLPYVAPEQIWGSRVDGRADLFSLGLVWYELLTSQRAVLGTSDVEILEAVKAWKIAPVPSLRPDCPPAIVALINRAMLRPVDLRFQTGREMANAIETALAHDRLVATQSQLVDLANEISAARSTTPMRAISLEEARSVDHGLHIVIEEPTIIHPVPKTSPGQPIDLAEPGASGLTPSIPVFVVEPSVSGELSGAPQPPSFTKRSTDVEVALSPVPGTDPMESVPIEVDADAPALKGPPPKESAAGGVSARAVPWPSSPDLPPAPASTAPPGSPARASTDELEARDPAELTQPNVPGNESGEARASWLGEAIRRLGIALPAERVDAVERARGSLVEGALVTWVLVVEPTNSAPAQPGFAALLTDALDVVDDRGGVLDDVDERRARFLFVGTGAHARAVLAAQELRERVEARLDGAPDDAPRLRLAVNGGPARVQANHALDGDVVTGAITHVGKAAVGQLLMPASFANAISDLVTTGSRDQATVEVLDRRPFAPELPLVGRDSVLAALTQRVAPSREPAPLVVVGPPRSGRTALADRLVQSARGQGLLVCATRCPPSLRGIAGSSVIDLVCQLCGVAPAERFTLLGPALDRLRVPATSRDEVLQVVARDAQAPPCEPVAAVKALRAVLDASSDVERRWLILFDGLDEVDPLGALLFRELCRQRRPLELVAGFTTPAGAATIEGIDRFELSPLSSADVTTWLVALLGRSPSPTLRQALESRCNGLPGLLTDWVRLAAARGLLRPRGEGLVLEGELPPPTIDLEAARVSAAGTRLARQLEAVVALGDRATLDALEEVLPGQATARLLASGLVRVANGMALAVSPAVEQAARAHPLAGGRALAARVSAALAARERPVEPPKTEEAGSSPS